MTMKDRFFTRTPQEFPRLSGLRLARVSRRSSASGRVAFSLAVAVLFVSTPAPVTSEENACRPGATLVDTSLGIRFRLVPGTPSSGREENEAVALRPFWIGETEVTRGQWHKLMGNRPGHFLECGDDCPVEMINGYEALAYANALSEKSGLAKCYDLIDCEGEVGGEGPYKSLVGMSCELSGAMVDTCPGYRLPTEAEWEHAARAGSTSDVYSGDLIFEEPRTSCGGPNLDSIAWYYCTSTDSTHPVATKTPNNWQVFDMVGNVSEWIWDCYTPGTCDRRTIKGCSTMSAAQYCTIDFRDGYFPDMRVLINVGFRLARSAIDDCSPGASGDR